MNKILFIAFCGVIALGGSVFRLKYQVVEAERHLHRTQKDLAHARESYHLLQAEWSYLTAPERLSQLLETHLPDWSPVRASQMKAMDHIGSGVEAQEKGLKRTSKRVGVAV
ncbi:MAG: hypothetical protein GY915_06405 [bacterium]|nr:hypothetical protein [bacterium]